MQTTQTAEVCAQDSLLKQIVVIVDLMMHCVWLYSATAAGHAGGWRVPHPGHVQQRPVLSDADLQLQDDPLACLPDARRDERLRNR